MPLGLRSRNGVTMTQREVETKQSISLAKSAGHRLIECGKQEENKIISFWRVWPVRERTSELQGLRAPADESYHVSELLKAN